MDARRSGRAPDFAAVSLDWRRSMASLIRSEDGTLLRSGSALGALGIWVATANNQRLALDDKPLLAVNKWASATVASAWGAQGAWPDAEELCRMWQRRAPRPS